MPGFFYFSVFYRQNPPSAHRVRLSVGYLTILRKLLLRQAEIGGTRGTREKADTQLWAHPPQTKRYAIQAGRHELPQATAANYGGCANTGEYLSQGRPMVARLSGVIPPVK